MRFLNIPLSVILVALIVGVGFTPTAAAADNHNLHGEWQAFDSESGKPIGPAEIRQKGEELRLNNGAGIAAREFIAKNKVAVPEWQVTGIISEHGKRIDWSNGTTGVRGNNPHVRNRMDK